MKRYTLLLSLLLTFALATTLSAQSLAGISIEAKSVPIIVYIDNTRVCNLWSKPMRGSELYTIAIFTSRVMVQSTLMPRGIFLWITDARVIETIMVALVGITHL